MYVYIDIHPLLDMWGVLWGYEVPDKKFILLKTHPMILKFMKKSFFFNITTFGLHRGL